MRAALVGIVLGLLLVALRRGGPFATWLGTAIVCGVFLAGLLFLGYTLRVLQLWG